MKLTFNGITLGAGPRYYLDRRIIGLDGDLQNINERVPRTDFSRNIADYLKPKVRTFSGTLIGTDQDDFRTQKRVLTNLLRQEFTFTLVDDYKDADGTVTTFATYTFDGKLISVKANDNDPNSNRTTYLVQILSENPVLNLEPAISETADISESGFVFPLIFPFVFSSNTNVITVTNSGLVDAWPTITLTGPFTNLTIVAEDSQLVNNQFKYNGTVVDGSVLTLVPAPNNAVKAFVDGVPAVANTNSNWEALKVQPGVNNFSFFADSGIGANTGVTFEFNSAFIAT